MGGGGIFGLSRTNLYEDSYSPWSNKGPVGRRRIGLSRIALSRARPQTAPQTHFFQFLLVGVTDLGGVTC